MHPSDVGACRQGAQWTLIAVVMLVTLAACSGFEKPAVPCGNGVCPPGRICVQGICVSADCGNGSQSPTEACDDGNPWSHDGCTARCVAESPVWVERTLASPSAVANHAMAYDAARGRVVMFGGAYDDDDYRRDTWQWDGTDWRQLVPATATLIPPARVGHALAYDAKRDRIVLFGGTAAGTSDVLGDTWEWDGIAWIQHFPEDDDRVPSARTGHAMAYDAGRGHIVLFGGQGDGGRRADTWAWDGTAWTDLTAAAGSVNDGEVPAARAGHAMTYDAARDRMVLFGGQDDSGVRNDTWVWGGTIWTELASNSDASPPARSGHAMAYDVEGGGRIVMFGGLSGNGAYLDDTWAGDGTDWQRLASTDLGPPARSEHVMIYHAALGHVVLFGGFDSAARDDLWVWDGTAWTSRSVASGPPAPRDHHAMAHDAGRGRLVLFGGFFGSDRFGDTWEWNGTSWRQRTPQDIAPSPRSSHAMAHDAGRGQTILFGGADRSARRGDTWAWDGMAWTQRSSIGVRVNHAMVYDRKQQRVVLFGGYDGARRNDIWAWNGSAWTELFPQGTFFPPDRSDHAMAYHEAKGHLVLFGGGENEAYGDTWTWDGTKWTEIDADAKAPSARIHHAMAYAAARERVVLFGGGDYGEYLNDTWEWDGTTWIESIPLDTSPSPRRGHALAYDAGRDRVVLFGGSFEGTLYDDTWEWDGESWTQFAPPTAPPARSNHAMAYDADCQCIVLFGGADDGLFIWTWNGETWQRSATSRSPSARDGHAMVYDAARGHIVLFGGDGDGSDSATNDTWILDGTAWTEKVPQSDEPSPRVDHALAYDALRGQVMLFGGVGYGGLLADTWIWSGAHWESPELTKVSPDKRSQHALAYDAARDRVVLFGGRDGNRRLNDTWEWNGSEWDKIIADGGMRASPAARYEHTMVYDAAYRRVVLFGGKDAEDNRLTDTWAWDGTVWERLFGADSTSPSTRNGHAMAYDSTRAQTVLVSGDETWQLRYRQDGYSETSHDDEYCRYGFDTDGDGLVGCDDADCWRYCKPFCMPAAPCHDSWPHCGDRICNPDLETHRMCPEDCTAPPTVCGDFHCDANESRASCPADCLPAD